MKIAIIGAAGKAGSLIMEEALERGHEVTAVVREASKVKNTNVQVIEKDFFNLESNDLKPFDAVVNAFNAAPGKEHLHVDAGRVLIQALENSTNTKLVVVGGAGSLFLDEEKTTRVMDDPNFPAAYFPTAKNMGINLDELQKAETVKWTYISPSANFDPQGIKTGTYHSGKDHLLTNSQGESYISYADYAIAVVDEIEKPKHKNERFTVVSK